MTYEDAFNKACGPAIKYLSYELFDNDKRLDVGFEVYGKEYHVGVTINGDLERAWTEAGRLARRRV